MNVSLATLERAPERAQRFLRGVVRNPAIYQAMLPMGYNAQHHQRGVVLLTEVIGLQKVKPSTPEANKRGVELLGRASELDGTLMTRIDGALRYSHPAQRDRLLEGLSDATDFVAAANLRVLFTRYSALATSADPQDQAATRALDERGINADWMRQLQELLQGLDAFQIEPFEPSTQEERQAALLALHAWWREWSNNARRAFTRRDWLVALGLAYRRTTPQGEEEIVLAAEEDPDAP